MKEYSKEREAFNLLREKCTEEMKREYECAVKILLEKYNTTIYENRFTVGGALEVFTCALLRSVGIGCELHADKSKSSDIKLSCGGSLSIKGSFTGGATNVKLINKLGGGNEIGTPPRYLYFQVLVLYSVPPTWCWRVM